MKGEQKPKKNLMYKIGISLILISGVFWIIPLAIPFLSLSGKTKTIGITSSIVIAEIMFWTGAIFVGKEVASKIRSYFNPKNWRRRKQIKEKSHENEFNADRNQSNH